MKITETELKNIIKEEALKLHKITLLENRKKEIDKMLNELVGFGGMAGDEDTTIASNERLAFDDEIKYELKRYLEETIHGKVGQTEERAKQLMNIHKKFIDNAKNKMSADEIAKKIYQYEINLNK